MLQTFNKSQIRCPIGFYEEIIAVICMKKSQITTEDH